ncbi:KH homology domain-containing protein 4 [Oncorhynchus kisutch]|uniref:KH homology domain-containing protein 4 n=1 Tax=Oncorhynchus kisutch TaxID=8019 RepID=A0A8C7JSN6_ONCKI|nr:KH homology domain-containing protein 4-like [Oncorhynchus kisutch]XP_031676747.1 KH homology domain-containing protein 4-like [Oncorhynchus kisutch]
MSSGMTGQTPCLTNSSRWDQPAQPKTRVDVMQGFASSAQTCTSATTTPQLAQHPVAGPMVPQTLQGEMPAAQGGGVEMAAAMAAKINAMLMAKGKLMVPPPLPGKIPLCMSAATSGDETVVTEVDINDVPINSRNLLTKGKTQEEIRQFSGAVVSTRGHYMTSAEKSHGKGVERPLYLHVQGKSQEEVNKAVLRIKEIISEDVLRTAAALGSQLRPVIPPLPLYPQPPRPMTAPHPHLPRMPSVNPPVPHGHRPAAPHQGSFVHVKIFVGLDQSLPSFNVNEKVEGPAGMYLGHIQTETGARVFLRGKGSGYIEQASRRESFEPLYVYISHPYSTGLEAAKKLTESLLETVRAEHSRMVSIYTATGSTQPYPAHGYPANSSYSSQGWYSSGYPGCNGLSGGYAASTSYPTPPGPSGYWTSAASGQPSQSNLSTNPPSSQAMVQYPVCPRKTHPYLLQDPGCTDPTETDQTETDLSSSSSPQTETGSPKRRFQEKTEDERASQPASSSPEAPVREKSPPLPPAQREEESGQGAERMLMPPPLPVFLAPGPVARKRPRETAVPEVPPSLPPRTLGPVAHKRPRETAVPEVPPSLPPRTLGPVAHKRPKETAVPEVPPSLPPSAPASQDCPQEVKKTKVVEKPSCLVPYGGDSSDEGEDS